jgi:integrase
VDTGDGCTLQLLCNEFLNTKRKKLETAELSERSFRDYFSTCERLIGFFRKDQRVDDLCPKNFEDFRSVLAERYGTVALKNEINRCRVVFKYAKDMKLITDLVEYGKSFDRPSVKMIRLARNEAGENMFKTEEVRLILDALDGKEVRTTRIDDETGEPEKVKLKSDPVLKSMVLLGLNCGFGNTDVAMLPQSAIDFDNGWIVFPRPKTEINRRIPMWTESAKALQEVITCRPDVANKTDDNLCFATPRGFKWVSTKPGKKSSELCYGQSYRVQVWKAAAVSEYQWPQDSRVLHPSSYVCDGCW